MGSSDEDRLDGTDLRPGQEPLTPEEKESFLARVRAQGRTLTSEEMYALFGPQPEPKQTAPVHDDIDEMDAALLDEGQLAQLQADFFPGLREDEKVMPGLVQGIIFDFDYTLATPTQLVARLWEEGARAAEAYMRSTGMDLPDNFHTNIIETRRFAEEKSEEEREEHLADDAMSFLLQFFGYPASRMDPAVLRTAVDLFYAPEMTAWKLRPGARELLETLRSQGYKMALLANYNCDRVFQRTIDYLGIREYFDLCLCSGSVEYRKPDTRYFQIVLDHWRVLPYEVVVVGDSLVNDIKGAIDLGSQAVLVRGETAAQVALENEQYGGQIVPDAEITDLLQLPAMVTAWT